jgi:TolA-binding protein
MVERPGKAAPVTVGFLMKSGRAYQEQGNVYQATHAYCDVLDHYPETKQAQEARDRLVKIAQEYEESGQLHMAKHLCRRIGHAIGA